MAQAIPETDPRVGDSSGDWAPVIMLALSVSGFFFLCLLCFHARDGISERDEGQIFTIGWLTIPALALLTARGLEGIRRKFFSGNALFFPALLVSQSAYWLETIYRIRTALPPGGKPLVDARPLMPFVIVFPIASGAAIAVARIFGSSYTQWRGRALAESLVQLALPLVAAIAMGPFSTRTYPDHAWVVVACVGIGAFLHYDLSSFPMRRKARYALDALTTLTLVLLIGAPIRNNLIVFTVFEHHNYYLGPVAAILAGKSPLVDVNCQYGVGVLYFIALAFKTHLVPTSIGGLWQLTNALLIMEYALIYGLMRYLLRSAGLAALTLALIVFVNFCCQEYSPLFYPSTGPIRFLLGYVLLAVVCLGSRFPRWRHAFRALEYGTLAVASIWSVESFFYTVVAYLGVVVYESLSEVDLAHALRRLARRLGAGAACCLVAQLALCLVTYARSGSWPHWSYYLDYVALYSTGQFGTLPVIPWTPWLPVVAIYLASLLALGCKRFVFARRGVVAEETVVCGVTALGIAQFTYFVGRSDPNNLRHICMPAICIASYWFVRTMRAGAGVTDALRGSLAYVTYAIIGLILLVVGHDVVACYGRTLLAAIASGQTIEVEPYAPTSSALDAIGLLNKYAPGSRHVGLFVDENVQVAVFLETGKANIWPLSYLSEDQLLPAAVARAVHFPHGLKVNDIIFVALDAPDEPNPSSVHFSKSVGDVQQQVLGTLLHEFQFSVLDKTPSGICAVRLLART